MEEKKLKDFIPKFDNKIDNKLINNNNEIEFKLRSTAFKYEDLSYYSDLDNLIERKEFDTIAVRKFNGMNLACL